MTPYKIKLDGIFICSLVVMMVIILPRSGDDETNNYFLVSVGCNLYFVSIFINYIDLIQLTNFEIFNLILDQLDFLTKYCVFIYLRDIGHSFLLSFLTAWRAVVMILFLFTELKHCVYMRV